MSVPELRLAHATRGRMRLRVVGDGPGDRWWNELERTLADCPAVSGVSVRPATGSVVVEHAGPRQDVLSWARERELFAARVDERTPARAADDPLAHVAEAMDAASEHLRRAAGGRLDLRTVAFYGLIGAGVLQISRGHFLPAAETLLTHALGLLPERGRREA